MKLYSRTYPTARVFIVNAWVNAPSREVEALSHREALDIALAMGQIEIIPNWDQDGFRLDNTYQPARISDSPIVSVKQPDTRWNRRRW